MNKLWAFKTLKATAPKSVCRRYINFSRLFLVSLTTVIGVYLLSGVSFQQSDALSLFVAKPAIAQLVRPQDLWKQVYQSLPDFPLENQYISKETGKPSTNNTLASRLIRYHIYVKSRTPNYRLDWKLTLADYLGANERLQEAQYPGYDTLQQNPIEGDRAAISRLNRRQRDALINVLVNIFNPNSENNIPVTKPSDRPSPQASPTPTRRAVPSLPKPGSAELLK